MLYIRSKSLPRAGPLAVSLLAALLTTMANGQTREWTGATGSWFDVANWSGSVLPTAADRVEINNGGTAQITIGTALADAISLADNINSSGFIEVSGSDAALIVADSGFIGRAGAASMLVNAGATVSLGTSLIVGDQAGFSSSLIVADSGTTMDLGTLLVGRLGPGVAAVSDGASMTTGSIVVSGSNVTGELEITGGQTTLSSSSFVVIEGSPAAGAGAPSLLISDGAVLNMTGGSNSFVSIDRGMARVTDAGSVWTIPAFLVIGDNGAGVLTVAEGGRVAVGDFTSLGRFAGDTGTVNIGMGGAPGVLDIATLRAGSGAAVVNFNHTASAYHFTRDATLAGSPVTLSGNLSVQHMGSGTTVLTGTHNHTGPTTIDAGELRLNGSMASAVTVNAGGTFSGIGNSSGALTVNDNAALTPGDDGPGVLSTGSLSLAAAAQMEFELGAPAAVNDRIDITGNLVLDGTLSLTPLPGLVSGTFTLFNYSGSLTDNTLEVGGLPAGQVKLVVFTPEPVIEITPQTLDFGAVVVATSSPSATVTLASTGTGILAINAIDAATTPFVRSGGSCPMGAFMLPVGNNCTIAYRFAPTDTGQAMQTINVVSNAISGPTDFELIGDGVAPELLIMPVALDFGNLDLAAPAVVLPLQLENAGSSDLFISALSFGGANADDFSVSANACNGVALAFGQSCTLEISFDPADPGVKTAELTIDSNDPLAPTLVPLSGSRDVRFADGFESP